MFFVSSGDQNKSTDYIATHKNMHSKRKETPDDLYERSKSWTYRSKYNHTHLGKEEYPAPLNDKLPRSSLCHTSHKRRGGCSLQPDQDNVMCLLFSLSPPPPPPRPLSPSLTCGQNKERMGSMQGKK